MRFLGSQIEERGLKRVRIITAVISFVYGIRDQIVIDLPLIIDRELT